MCRCGAIMETADGGARSKRVKATLRIVPHPPAAKAVFAGTDYGLKQIEVIDEC